MARLLPRLMLQTTIAVLLCVSTGSVTVAGPIKQWSNKQGIASYGDEHAAPVRGSRQVEIHNPMSIVTNSNPAPVFKLANDAAHPKKFKRNQSASRSSPASASSNNTKANKQRCEKLRESLATPSKNPMQHTAAQYRYEQECVKGMYYSDDAQ